jgi:hypothetical protein
MRHSNFPVLHKTNHSVLSLLHWKWFSDLTRLRLCPRVYSNMPSEDKYFPLRMHFELVSLDGACRYLGFNTLQTVSVPWNYWEWKYQTHFLSLYFFTHISSNLFLVHVLTGTGAPTWYRGRYTDLWTLILKLYKNLTVICDMILINL